MQGLRNKILQFRFMTGIKSIKKYKNDSQRSGLVLMRLDAMGDFVLAHSSLMKYRDLYDGHITLICNEYYVDLAKSWNIADEIIGVNMKKLYSSFEYRKDIKKILTSISCDIFVQLVFHQTVEMVYLAGLIKSTRKIAPKRDTWNSKIKKYWDRAYTEIVDINTNEFVVKTNFDLLNSVMNSKERSFLADLPVMSDFHNPCDEYIIIAPGGSYSAKKWETSKYIEVINCITKNHDMCVILIGDKNDSEICRDIMQNVEEADRIYDYSAKTDLFQMIEIIRNANGIVTNDTAFAHIAAAVNTFCVVVVGGWEWGRFYPYSVEEKNNKTMPIPAYIQMDCFRCYFHNKKCRKLKESERNNTKLPCVSNVDVNIVLELLDRGFNNAQIQS